MRKIILGIKSCTPCPSQESSYKFIDGDGEEVEAVVSEDEQEEEEEEEEVEQKDEKKEQVQEEENEEEEQGVPASRGNLQAEAVGTLPPPEEKMTEGHKLNHIDLRYAYVNAMILAVNAMLEKIGSADNYGDQCQHKAAAGTKVLEIDREDRATVNCKAII
eukprot:g33077.t1